LAANIEYIPISLKSRISELFKNHLTSRVVLMHASVLMPALIFLLAPIAGVSINI